MQLWPSALLALLLDGHPAEFEQFVNLAAGEGLVHEEFRLSFARALFVVATPARPCLPEISAMARVLFGRAVGTLPPAPASVQRWQLLDTIPELDPKWKLNLARQLFEPPASEANARFGDAVRGCILSLGSIAPGNQISALAALI